MSELLQKNIKYITVIIIVIFISIIAISSEIRHKISNEISQYFKPVIKIAVLGNATHKNFIGYILKERYRISVVDLKNDYDIILDTVDGKETMQNKKGIKIFYGTV